MLPIILSPKVIEAFKTKLKTSLAAVGYNDSDQNKIADAATDIFAAIARANPLKPKTLPDTGPDVLTTLRKLGGGRAAKTELLKNPAHLFETHDIKVPVRDITDTEPARTPETTTQTAQRKPRLPRSPQKRSDTALVFSVEDIIEAAKDEYKNSGLRPDTTLGKIETGQLSGTNWSKIYGAIQNNAVLMNPEGFTRLSQIFDVAMIGVRHKPCKPEKARKAFCEVFDIAAGFVPTDIFHLNKRREDSYARLPYVFRMLEDSLIEMQKARTTPLTSFDTIDKGSLAGMGLDFETVNDMFFKAKNDFPEFPFHSLGDFIAFQNIYRKAKIILPEQKP